MAVVSDTGRGLNIKLLLVLNSKERIYFALIKIHLNMIMLDKIHGQQMKKKLGQQMKNMGSTDEKTGSADEKYS